MFGREGDGQLGRLRNGPLHELGEPEHEARQRGAGQAGPIEHLVAFGVFAAVHRFLADERRHRLLQLRLDDLRAIVANGVNEEALTVRKEQRQCIEEMRSEEQTSELQSLMRSSYAVLGWIKKKNRQRMKKAKVICNQSHNAINQHN